MCLHTLSRVLHTQAQATGRLYPLEGWLHLGAILACHPGHVESTAKKRSCNDHSGSVHTGWI